jgi:hypothetical protein
MMFVLVVALIGLLLDERVITGAPAWLKPMKFAVSISIYCFTLLWMLTFVRGRRRFVGLISWVTAVALFVEMVLIAGAAALGTTSHFNVSTPTHAAVWYTMAGFVALVWAMNLLAALLLLIQRMPDPAFAWALRLGILVSLVGMGVAFLMTSETPALEQAADAAGTEAPIQGAHAVGVEDGGPGLPVTGWSTTGGDLRVPHFVGLHGLQALPLFGYLLALAAPAWLRPGTPGRVGVDGRPRVLGARRGPDVAGTARPAGDLARRPDARRAPSDRRYDGGVCGRAAGQDREAAVTGPRRAHGDPQRGANHRVPYRNASVESAAHGSVTNTAHRTGSSGPPG